MKTLAMAVVAVAVVWAAEATAADKPSPLVIGETFTLDSGKRGRS
jgi:hypothetical protein